MRSTRKLLALLLALMMLTLSGCKKGEAVEEEEPEKEPEYLPAPVVYTFGENEVGALAGYGVVTVLETANEETGEMIYEYSGMKAIRANVAAYSAQMTDEVLGFVPVTAENVKTDLPDYTQPSGTTILVRKDGAQEGDILQRIEINWSEESCKVSVRSEEGKIKIPQPERKPSRRTMTRLEALDFFRALEPGKLGLEGSAMSDYSVYALSGLALVDDQPCMQVNVYTTDNPQGTNVLLGEYLMTGDGGHIYQKDSATGALTELKLESD